MTNFFYAVFPLMLVLFVVFEIKWRQRERKLLAEREMERQAYTSQILKAQEDERQRIAQSLHDDTTQTLLVLANQANYIFKGKCKNDSETKKSAAFIRDTSAGLAEEMRRISLALRPGILDNMGLIPALRWLVDRIKDEGNIDTQLIVKGKVRQLKTDEDVIVFRIVQEALSNIRRHSKATNACVNCEFTQDSFRLSIVDNGIGFSVPSSFKDYATKGKLGLIGIQQRIKGLEGALTINSARGNGVIISMELIY
jgi:signal transduction histidine kinase